MGSVGVLVGWLVSKMRVWNVLLCWPVLFSDLFGMVLRVCGTRTRALEMDGWMEMTVGKSTENLKAKKKEGATRKKGKGWKMDKER